jgi:hypothetical protein
MSPRKWGCSSKHGPPIKGGGLVALLTEACLSTDDFTIKLAL